MTFAITITKEQAAALHAEYNWSSKFPKKNLSEIVQAIIDEKLADLKKEVSR